MSAEKLIHGVVVLVAVRAKREQINEHGRGRLQVAALESPNKWRNVLRADLHEQHPFGPLAARRTRHGLIEQRAGIDIDRLHDDGRPLGNGAHQHLGDQPEAAAEGFHNDVVDVKRSKHFDACRDEGCEELGRDRVTDVPKTQRRNVIDHFHGVTVNLQGHVQDPVSDHVQVRVRLLEEVLPPRRRGKERRVYARPELVPLMLLEAIEKPRIRPRQRASTSIKR
mmetsp:Transcript_84580/g.235972  ORF Transcript_84580/g.235972 Transcript_84580/m.235972 type:complete len:224 (+) Transcript_84580:1762-2433(+)